MFYAYGVYTAFSEHDKPRSILTVHHDTLYELRAHVNSDNDTDMAP